MRYFTSIIGIAGLLLSVACTGAIDGGGGGGGSGGMTTDPPPTDVQIVVRDGYVPQANVRVLFQSSDGSLISEVKTDATGLASADMPDGGNLTVIRVAPTVTPPDTRAPDEVYTYVGVEPGDRLVLGHEMSDATPAAINVVVPSSAQGTVKVVTSCGSGEGTPPNIAITATGCPPELDFYVTDQSNSSFVAHAAYGPSVDLSNETFAGRLTTTLSATNVPPGATVSIEDRMVSGTYALFSSGDKRVDTQPASVDVPNVQGPDELTLTSVRSQAGGTQLVARRQPYAATPTIVDASAGLLPGVSQTTFSPTGASWLEDGAGTADFVLVVLDVTRDPADGAIGANPSYLRAVIAPHAGTSLVLPMLSGADAIYNPTAADQLAGTQGLGAATGGYDAARATAFSVASVVETAPMDGSVTLSYAGNTPPGF